MPSYGSFHNRLYSYQVTPRVGSGREGEGLGGYYYATYVLLAVYGFNAISVAVAVAVVVVVVVDSVD